MLLLNVIIVIVINLITILVTSGRSMFRVEQVELSEAGQSCEWLDDEDHSFRPIPRWPLPHNNQIHIHNHIHFFMVLPSILC